MTKYGDDPKLCDFNKVELKVPRMKLLKLLKKYNYLSQSETAFLRELLHRTEQSNYKILHIQSIIEKCLFKASAPQR